MHMEVNAEEPTKAVNARSDDRNHKNSAHHLLKKHLPATTEAKEKGKHFTFHFNVKQHDLARVSCIPHYCESFRMIV